MEYIKSYKKNFLKHLISAPFIYVVFFGFVVLDIFVEIYHRVCFPLYGLELVERKKYIKFDRHRLSYLSPLQKFNCLYCSYGNGLINYVSEIAGRTEKYWCGIQHAKDPNFIAPKHHENFLAYGDERAYITEYFGEEERVKCKLEG